MTEYSDLDLTPDTKTMLHLPAHERAAACCRDIWVEYPSAFLATERVKSLVSLPRCSYNPGMMLVGLSGAGKSRLAQRWVEQSWESESVWAGRLIYVDMSEDTENLDVRKRVIEEIGKACGRPEIRTVQQARRIIREYGIVAIIIDELGETEEAIVKRHWKANLLAVRGFASGAWGVNLILVGIPAFLEAVMLNEQLRSRFANRVARLNYWTENDDLAAFVLGYVRHMPMRQVSAVATDRFIGALLQYSLAAQSGATYAYASLRSIVDLLKETFRQALLSGKEYVTEANLLITYKQMGGNMGLDPKDRPKLTVLVKGDKPPKILDSSKMGSSKNAK
ncbi:TniB family NTP-binding protein [Pseudomonas sp. s4]|uniref:TniB family NTP-binding protein n=1 Tax=Pseudomonas sp. s4 TaxID=353218 RepID=UPI00398CE8CE